MTIDGVNQFKCTVESCTNKKKGNGYCEKHQFLILNPEQTPVQRTEVPTSLNNPVSKLLQVFGVVWVIAGIVSGVYQGQLTDSYEFNFFTFVAYGLSGITVGLFLFGIAEIIAILSKKEKHNV